MRSADANERILVVDDDPLNRTTVARTLEKSGFTTTTASDGEGALDLISTEQFDAVVSDVNMPRMTGLELLKQIQSRFPCLPVILMTGLATDEVRATAFAEGAAALFQKPVRREALVAVVALGFRVNNPR